MLTASYFIAKATAVLIVYAEQLLPLHHTCDRIESSGERVVGEVNKISQAIYLVEGQGRSLLAIATLIQMHHACFCPSSSRLKARWEVGSSVLAAWRRSCA